MIEEVCEGRIVSETTISSCVKAARKVLGDDGGQQRFIRTARGRGFQFIHDVRIIESSEHVTDDIKQNNVSRSRFFVAAVLVISVVLIGVYAFIPSENSSKTNSNDQGSGLNSSFYTIAVMPFEDMSVNGDQGYFGRGVSEEILNVLTGIDDLDLTSRTTAFSSNISLSFFKVGVGKGGMMLVILSISGKSFKRFSLWLAASLEKDTGSTPCNE